MIGERRLSLGTRSLVRSESGASLVEFALVLPILLLLLIGTVDIGRFVYQGIEIANAAHAGAEYGAQSMTTAADTATPSPGVSSPPGGIVQATLQDAHDISSLSVTPSNYCACGSDPATAIVSCTGASPCASPDRLGVYVKVVDAATFTTLIKYPGIPSSLTISRTAIQEVSP